MSGSTMSMTYDTNISNNTGIAIATYLPVDIAISKSVLPPTAVSGDSVAWTLTYTNIGTSPINGYILVYDLMPTGFVYQSSISSFPPLASGQCTPS